MNILISLFRTKSFSHNRFGLDYEDVLKSSLSKIMLIFIALSYFSCEDTHEIAHTYEFNDIKVFEDSIHLKKELLQLSKMSINEAIDYTNNPNFKSLMSYQTDAYEDFLKINFISSDELLDYAISDPYLKINYIDEDTTPTIDYMVPIKSIYFLLNKDSMIIVKDKVYKIFHQGFLSTEKSNIEILKKEKRYNSDNKLFVKTDNKRNEFSRVNDVSNNHAKWIRTTKTVGKDRVILEIEVYDYDVPHIGRAYAHGWTGKAYRKRFGVWILEKRTLFGSIQYKMGLEDDIRQTGWERYSFEALNFQLSGQSVYRGGHDAFLDITWTSHYVFPYHIDGSNSIVWTVPTTDNPAHIVRSEHLF